MDWIFLSVMYRYTHIPSLVTMRKKSNRLQLRNIWRWSPALTLQRSLCVRPHRFFDNINESISYWLTAASVLCTMSRDRFQCHDNNSAPVGRILHLHHTWPQNVCKCSGLPLFAPTRRVSDRAPFPLFTVVQQVGLAILHQVNGASYLTLVKVRAS